MVNKLILGTVQFGLPYGINNSRGQVPPQEAFEILEKAEVAGITYLDTAAGYGESEKLIGDFFKNKKNSSLKVITKLALGNSDWKSSLQKSADFLGEENIEVVLFHNYKDYQDNIDRIDEIIEYKKHLPFKRLGVSVYTNDEIEQVLRDERIEIIQVPFNLLDNSSQREAVLLKAKAAGKEVHVRSAFLQGIFFKTEKSLPEQLKDLEGQLLKLQALAKENSIPVGVLALKYALSKEYIDRVLIGVDSLQQLEQNLQWADEQVSPAIFKQVDRIKVENIDLLNPSLWKK